MHYSRYYVMRIVDWAVELQWLLDMFNDVSEKAGEKVVYDLANKLIT